MSNSTPLFHPLLLLLPLLLQLHLSVASVASDQSECTEQLVGLATCLPYVQGSSKTPTPDCCTGLKEVLKKSPKCLCVLIKDRDDPQLGLKINLPLALGLPSACSAPAKISECPKILKLDPNSPEAKIFTQPQSTSQSTASNSTSTTGKGNTTTAAHEKSGAMTRPFRKVETVGLLLFLFSLFFFI